MNTRHTPDMWCQIIKQQLSILSEYAMFGVGFWAEEKKRKEKT